MRSRYLTAFATAWRDRLRHGLGMMRQFVVSLMRPAINLMRSCVAAVIFWFYFLVPYIGQWVTLGSAGPGGGFPFVRHVPLFEAAYFAEIMPRVQ
jgi:hypothetical protein